MYFHAFLITYESITYHEVQYHALRIKKYVFFEMKTISQITQIMYRHL